MNEVRKMNVNFPNISEVWYAYRQKGVYTYGTIGDEFEWDKRPGFVLSQSALNDKIKGVVLLPITNKYGCVRNKDGQPVVIDNNIGKYQDLLNNEEFPGELNDIFVKRPF